MQTELRGGTPRGWTETQGAGDVRKLFTPAEADQVGVVPYRIREGRIEVLLITSRGSGRWVIPKGGLLSGHGPRRSARVEAYEEAGVTGPLGSTPIGLYRHGRSKGSPLVQVFLMRVEKEADEWPEKDERSCRWMPVEEAVRRVRMKGLRAILQEAATLLHLTLAADPQPAGARHPAIPPIVKA